MMLIKEELTEVSFNTWLKSIIPIDIEDETIILSIPDKSYFRIVKERYSKLISNTLYNSTDINLILEYEVFK